MGGMYRKYQTKCEAIAALEAKLTTLRNQMATRLAMGKQPTHDQKQRENELLQELRAWREMDN